MNMKTQLRNTVHSHSLQAEGEKGEIRIKDIRRKDRHFINIRIIIYIYLFNIICYMYMYISYQNIITLN